MAPQSKGGKKTQKNKPANATKANSQTPKKLLVCYFLVIRIKK